MIVAVANPLVVTIEGAVSDVQVGLIATAHLKTELRAEKRIRAKKNVSASAKGQKTS
jgi:hypothetical protein